jgi:hypothetical protein
VAGGREQVPWMEQCGDPAGFRVGLSAVAGEDRFCLIDLSVTLVGVAEGGVDAGLHTV